MSRQSVPRIQPEDLRDVASEERVDRIWTRLEQDLVAVRAAPPARASRVVVWAVAATFAAFGGGLLAGRAVWTPAQQSPSAVVAASDRTTLDVFAAGSQERTYTLPGGGRITLAPGSMIELEHAGSNDMRLRLLSGEASFNAAQGSLAIVSGEALVATAPGSLVQVQKRDDNLDVRVATGSAQVTSPAGMRALQMGEQLDGVPTRTTTTSVNPHVVRVSPTTTTQRASRDDAPTAQVATAPTWRDHYDAGRFAEALSLLNTQSGGVSAAVANAKTAAELMAISDVARYRGGDPQAAIRALQRVADEFGGSPNAPIAALGLAKYYETTGQADLAKKYRDQATKGVLGEDAICDQMRAEHRAGNKTEASERASEYLRKYPNGRCKDDANRILSSGDADGDGESSDPAENPAPPSTSATAPSGSSSASAAPAPAGSSPPRP